MRTCCQGRYDHHRRPPSAPARTFLWGPHHDRTPVPECTDQTIATSERARPRMTRGRSMKKASRKPTDELRTEYKRSDLGRLTRGKYAQRVADAANVVVLDPRLAKEFPNDRAVNKALRGLLRKRKSSPRPTGRSPRTRSERSAGE